MKNEEFVKLNKTQKLKIPQSDKYKFADIDIALFIPTGKKNESGYGTCAFFVKIEDMWHRAGEYDAFRFSNMLFKSPYEGLRGDFENNGIQFFLGGDYKCDSSGDFERVTN